MITVKLAGRLRDDGVIAIALHPGVLLTAIATPRGPHEDPAEAAGEIVTLVESLTLEQSGSFLHRDGSTHPW
jgi:hypothetical protein